MSEINRNELESSVTKSVIDFVQSQHGSVSARVVAGALMRASVGIASEIFGEQSAPQVCRSALDNILINLEPWRLQ